MMHNSTRTPPNSDDFIAAILESSSQAIIATDRQGRIFMSNARVESMFGYTREELYGQPIEILIPESARHAHEYHRAKYVEAPRVRPMGVGYDLSARRKNGTEFPVEISLSYTTAGGEMVAIAFVSDISGRKLLEEQLIQSRKMEAVGRLAGGIAHDFNNLLTIISGQTRIVMDQLATIDPLRGNMEEVAHATERAIALTRQLLAFGRRQIVQPKAIDLNQTVTAIESMLRRLIGENIDLKTTLSPKLGTVKADRSQMEQVIMNLVLNARDAIVDHGSIAIETGNVYLDQDYTRTHLGVQPGTYAMLAVTDTGVGMTAETRSRIFEPFYSTKGDAGTGLGLATVYGIVKQNGGDIWVYSEPGHGTTFKIYLPQTPDESTDEPVRPEIAARRGSETILVVEDERGVRELIVQLLKKNGYKVLQASEPVEAMAVSNSFQGPIHLLLTDVVMPKGNGRQLAERLLAVRRDIKVLYMSGYTEASIVDRGVLNDGIAFISKPFSFEELLRKVRDALAEEDETAAADQPV